jgi:uncharacterized protein (TIGR03435 family)
MLQSFLAERFKLVVRRETREVRTYALVIAKRDGTLGPQLRPTPKECGEAPSYSVCGGERSRARQTARRPRSCPRQFSRHSKNSLASNLSRPEAR